MRYADDANFGVVAKYVHVLIKLSLKNLFSVFGGRAWHSCAKFTSVHHMKHNMQF